ncbi:hypothetical protein [Acinetobacter johnsonii]|uniref:hypothetical protein n=1 Tax=Acinetobacter johnsonii TaxID=40214 RepID=UPI001F23F39D|nr:hypothetical protein [Acinetobacter johnsonii]UJA01136.1 hypothetical protein GBN93_09360 [Acinetobacter johnsonii]
MKKYYLILPTFVLLTVTPFAFSAVEEGISLKKKCIKDYPLVNGETDHNLLSLYAQICDSKNKKNDELRNNLLVQAASRYQELGKSYKALQLVEELNARNINHTSLTDTSFLAGVSIANTSLNHMRQEEMRYLSADLTYPPAKDLSDIIRNSLPAPDTSDAKAVVIKASKKSTRKTASSTKQTTKKTTAQVAKPKKVEKVQKVQSTEVTSKPNTNPFNSL